MLAVAAVSKPDRQRAQIHATLAQAADGFACGTMGDNVVSTGIASQDIDELFQPPHRLHLRREYECNGLGLSLCQQIEQVHGGSGSVRSVTVKGSRFMVKLALAR